jgi:hypothetical protein
MVLLFVDLNKIKNLAALPAYFMLLDTSKISTVFDESEFP